MKIKEAKITHRIKSLKTPFSKDRDLAHIMNNIRERDENAKFQSVPTPESPDTPPPANQTSGKGRAEY